MEKISECSFNELSYLPVINTSFPHSFDLFDSSEQKTIEEIQSEPHKKKNINQED